MTAYRSLVPALAIVAGLAFSAQAQAQPNGNAWGYWKNHGDVRAAYDNGYRIGYDRGLQDLRSHRYDARRDDVYRNGDSGYDRRYGDRNDYRRSFQQGFIAGYDAAYYGRGGNVGRYPTYPSYPSYPSSGYPSYPSYPSSPGGYGNYGGYGGYGYSEAYDKGYRDGLDKGRDDGHDRDRYDPRRQKWYRNADRGYNNR